jgi:ABC-type protease/lipase transport system fused ATPase/permease subunit
VKQHFIYAGAFSAAINMLQLTPILYMLNVYDRALILTKNPLTQSAKDVLLL